MTHCLMADETGAVVLCLIGEDGRPVPISEQNGNWSEWIAIVDSMRRQPGDLVPVEFPRRSIRSD